MANFEYYTPTRVVFGRDAEKQTADLLQKYSAKKVLVHYGGASAQKSGLLDTIFAELKEAKIEYVELGGVVPNPRLTLVHKGIELCKQENVDFILAVGGGSVIDSAKAIAYGVLYDGDVWDLYERKAEPAGSLPVGAVLTIAAAGSEMSNSSVITNEEKGVKRGLGSEYGRCKFAVMNPALTLSLPAYQTAAGCADILMHTLERYFTSEKSMQLTDEIAEGLLRTVIHNAQILTRDPQNYDARAEIMWASSLSHNDLTGTVSDGSTHQLGHELSAKYDIAHGASLTAVWGSWARYVYKTNPARFAQLGVKVLGLEADGSELEIAREAIEEIESFFWGLEMPTSLEEAGIEITPTLAEELAEGCSFGGTRTIGSFKVLTKEDMAKIYRMAETEKE